MQIYVISYVIIQVFIQIDTDRYIYLHVSIPPAPPDLSEHYSAPVLQRQCLHRAATQSTKVTCGFAGKIVIFEVGSRKRLSGAHRAKKCMGRNTLLACRPASEWLEITWSRSPRLVGRRGEGR